MFFLTKPIVSEQDATLLKLEYFIFSNVKWYHLQLTVEKKNYFIYLDKNLMLVIYPKFYVITPYQKGYLN